MSLIERRQRILSVRARQTRIARLRLAEAQRRLERLEGTASQLARMAATLTPDQGQTDGLSLRARWANWGNVSALHLTRCARRLPMPSTHAT